MKEGIVVDPNIHFGKPCVEGTRIPVHNVLELAGKEISFEKIIQDYYPELKIEDIRACVKYAMDVLELNAFTSRRRHRIPVGSGCIR